MQDQLQYLIDRLEKIDTKYDVKLDKILEQTTKTNGRVNALEGRNKILWAAACIGGTVVGFVIEHYISKF